MTVTSSDVFTAILALDSYDRNNNEGIDLPISQPIGNYTVIDQMVDPVQSFYAIAYKDNAGHIIISYRGTDDFVVDPVTGWSVGAGVTVANQAPLAIQFFEKVVNEQAASGGNYSVNGASTSAQQTLLSNVTLTGHSLGGGLAGYVGSLTYVSVEGFDHMPFGLAAWVTYSSEILNRIAQSADALTALGLVGLDILTNPLALLSGDSAVLKQIIQTVAADLTAPPPPDWSEFNGYFIQGEVNTYLRNGGIAGVLGAGAAPIPFVGEVLSALGSAEAVSQAGFESTVSKTGLSTFGWTDQSVTDRHSSAVLVDLLYAQEHNLTQWQDAAVSNAILSGLFDDQVAGDLRTPSGGEIGPATGNAGPADQMQRMIAYSAIESGTLVFGNTSIQAMFNDADELALATQQSGTLKSGVLGLGDIVDEFAGNLAINKVSSTDHSDAVNGVLNYDAETGLLTVDLSKDRWSLDSSIAGPDAITGRTVFLSEIMNNGRVDGAWVNDNLSWLWNADDSSIIDRIVAHTTNNAVSTTIQNENSVDHVTMEIFGDGNNTVSGATDDDFLVGGSGNDVLRADAGNNLLVGGAGDDTLMGGESKDILIGGSGYDTVDYSVSSGATPQPGALQVGISPDYINVQEAGTGNQDRLYDIENLKLTDQDDKVVVVTLDPTGDSLTIDGGSQSTPAGDQIDFSPLNTGLLGQSNGIYFMNGGVVKPSNGNQPDNSAPTFRYTNFETVYGTSGADIYEDGTTTNVKVFLGAGADVVAKAGAGTEIDLGANDGAVDLVNAAALGDVQIDNMGNEDQVYVNAQRLYGGNRNTASDSSWAVAFGGEIKFGLSITGGLEIQVVGMAAAGVSGPGGSIMTIAGWGSTYNTLGTPYLGAGGIMLAQVTCAAYLVVKAPSINVVDGQLALLSASIYQATGKFHMNGVDPLVLDLNGDGFNIGVQSTSSPKFDTDADLYAENTAWLGREDGFLVRDINHDGQINDAREMFGGTQDGLSELATLDGNHDGVVNAADNGLADFNGDGVIDASDTFADLQIWRDLDQDGKVEDGEMQSLSAYDIVGLNTTATADDENINGSLVTATSTFIRGNGTTGDIGDAMLKLDNEHTQYIGPDVTISAAAAAAAEPDLSASGTLVTLRQALSVNPAAIATIEQVVAGFQTDQHDLATLRTDIRPLLQAWADSSPVRDSAGDIVPGSDMPNIYSDLSVIRTDGNVSDYSYGSRNETLVINGQDVSVKTYEFASGLNISVTASVNPSNILSEWGAPVSTTIVTETLDGQDKTTVLYTFANGQSLYGFVPAGDEQAPQGNTLSTLLDGEHESSDQQHTYSIDTTSLEDVAFYARYIGENIPLNVQPVDVTAALGMVDGFYSVLNQTLDMLAVRVAVQAPAFSSIFAGVTYDDVNNNFDATTPEQLTTVFASLLSHADQQADPVTWLGSWKPMLDIVVGDFNRGSGLVNTNGFVAGNIIAAWEQVHPSISLLDAADVLGVDRSLFITGDGVMQGTSSADIFYIHGDGQTAYGGDGLDNYIVGAHFNHTIIDDYESADDPHDDDVLRFTTLNASDFTFTRDGEDLTATVNATGETLTIVGQFHGEWPGIGGDGSLWADEGVANIVFADGTTWDDIDMAQAASHPDAASTTVIGTADNDFMDGGAGNDLLEGGGDGDIYVFGLGYGNDTISDLEDNPNRQAFDILEFKTGISEDDLTFHRDGNSDDVVITVNGDTADSVTIDGQFAATYTGVFGTIFSNQIEMITFADGGSMGPDDIDQKIIDQSETDGNDSVYGFSREDTLIGGKGDDFLSGGNEDDTYVFNLGDGHDTISDQETNILGGETDTLQFGAGIASSDVVFTRDGDDLVATIASTGDSVRIAGQYAFTETGVFGVRNFNLIENFAFADGTTRDWRSIMDDIVHAAETPGDDHVVGTHFNDTIAGGAGNDLLEGGDGDDTYVFALGDGHDTINDVTGNILAGGDDDAIVFGTGIMPGDIHIARTGDALENAVLTFGNDNEADSVTIDGQFIYGSINFRGNEIEHFTFADGTTWTPDDLRQHSIAQQETSGDDVVTGFYTDDTLDGGAGNDTLRGGDGNDTYRFEMGFGHDRIEENVLNAAYANNDSIVFGQGLNSTDATLTRNGNDLVIGFAGMTDTVTIAGDFTHIADYDGWQDIETVTFGDGVSWSLDDIRHKLIAQSETSGNDTVTGFWTADTLDGGAGDDLLIGNAGGDTFRFGIGDGHDTVVSSYSPYDAATVTDTVSFKTGVTADDVTFAKSGDDLVVTLADGTDVLTVQGQFTDAGEVETFAFADGATLGAAAVTALALAHAGTPGNDTIVGTSAADTIDGGAGNDLLQGGDGPDTYQFEPGFGQDTIAESVGNIGISDDDRIVFAAGIAPSDIGLSRNGNDLIVSVAGTSDSVTVSNQFGHIAHFDGNLNDIEHIVFNDGTSWSEADIQSMLIAQAETAGDDLVQGFWTADTLDGGAGNDTIYGNGGSDVFLFGHGSGIDTVYEAIDHVADPATATLQFKADVAPGDVVFSRSGDGDLVVRLAGTTDAMWIKGFFVSDTDKIDQFVFSDGTTYDAAQVTALTHSGTTGDDIVYGSNGAETLDGQGGQDVIHGGGGSDTFIYAAGYGHLEIDETDTDASADAVLSLSGIASTQVTVTRDFPGNVILTDGTSGDTVVLDNMANSTSGTQYGVQSVSFADGVTWTAADVLSRAATAAPTNDTLYGTSGPDTLDGHGGNDYAQGRGGNDTFIFDSGYGHLDINEYDTASGAGNVLRLGGFSPSAVTIGADRYGDLFLYDGVTGDQVTLENELSDGAYGVQSVVFDNGTTLSRQDLITRELSGTAASDTIYGTHGADTIDGHGGQDYAQGNGGGDIFVFNSGYGNLEISNYDTSSGAHNVLQLGAGIHPGDVTISTDRYGDILLADGVGGDQVTLDAETADPAYGVQSVAFTDGTTWSRAYLMDARIVGTTGNDTLRGTAGVADLLDGKGGNDYEDGRGGNDTFVFNSGYGHLEISEYDTASGAANILQLGAGLTVANIVVGADRYGDLILSDGTSGDQVTLDSELSDGAYGVQSVAFADGTTWTRQDLITRELNGTTGSDQIYGTHGADTIDGHGGSDYAQGNGGNDTFTFNSGYGHLEISEYDSVGSPANSLHFGAGIDPTSVLVSGDRYGDIMLADGTSGDQVTLDSEMSSNGYGVQSVTFANGTTWTRQDLIAREMTGTTAADSIYGTSGADTIDGHGGNDYAQGSGGGDSFIFDSGYGHLEINEYDSAGSPANSLHLGTGIAATDIVVTADRYADLILTDGVNGDQITMDSALSDTSYGVQSLIFADGTTWSRQDLVNKELNGTSGADTIYGTSGNDSIDGHAGNDVVNAGYGNDYIVGGDGDDDLTGGNGADTFVFRPGFGHATVEDFTSSDSDIIELSSTLFADYNDVMAHAATVGSSVVITYDAADAITLKNVVLANLHAGDFHFV